MPNTLKKKSKSKTIKVKKGGNGNKRARSRSSSNGSSNGSSKKRRLTPEQLKDLVIENIKNKKNYWLYDEENDEYIDFVNVNKFNKDKKEDMVLKEKQIKEQETRLLKKLKNKNYDINKIQKSKTMDLYGYYKDDENKNYYKMVDFKESNFGPLLILLEQKPDVEDMADTDDEKSDSIHSDSHSDSYND